MVEHLNAEIVLGTVSNVPRAVIWLQGTYLFVRVRLPAIAVPCQRLCQPYIRSYGHTVRHEVVAHETIAVGGNGAKPGMLQ
jgi:hypothetical protein